MRLISLARPKGLSCPPPQEAQGKGARRTYSSTSAGWQYPAFYLTLFLLQIFLSGCL